MSRESEAADRTKGTDRRSLLKGTAGAAILGMSGLGAGVRTSETAEPRAAVKNGRIQQSIVHWCFEKYWPIDEFIKSAKGLGIMFRCPGNWRAPSGNARNCRPWTSTPCCF